ncbi:hypothetical protein EDD22DRAFT_958354 [Suillus occidentalis]|nr:hypothetical protein EDD22DRAFT_958354 [Suillus occidentalis]
MSWDELLDHGDESFDLSIPPTRSVHPSLTLKAAIVQACGDQDGALSDIIRLTDAGHVEFVEHTASETVSHLNAAGEHFQLALDQCPASHPTIKPMSSSRPARKASTKRQYVEIDEDEDEEDKKSGRYKPGSDATAEDGFDSSEVEDDELTLGAEKNRLEVYGTKRIAATSSMKVVSQAPAKMRKLVSSRNYNYQRWSCEFVPHLKLI